jgi:hypothetical protein
MSSQIVVANQEDDFDAALAAIAAEYGIEAAPEISYSSSRIYTNFTTVEDIRVLKNKFWQDGITFQWNHPGNPELIEEFDGDLMNTVHQIGGIIVHSEIHSSLEIKNDDPNSKRNTRTLCSTVGYKKGDEYTQELPERVYFNSMYDPKAWDKVNNRPGHTTPNPEMKGLGLLGSRGKSCWDCIKSGESTAVDSLGKTNECMLNGRIFIYVTDLIRFKQTVPVKGKPPETTVIKKSVEELTGEPGFILMISLPNKVGLKGFWDRDNESKRRQGYLGYLKGLQIKYRDYKGYDKTSPKVNYTRLSIKPPVEGTDNNKNFLCFEEVPIFDKNLVMSALSAWRDLHPKVDPPILDAANWVINGKGGTTEYYSATVEPTSFNALPETVAESYEDEDNFFGNLDNE